MEKKDGNQISVELPDNIADGEYSNLAIITHSNQEFVVDFIRMVPGVPKAKVKSRVILTPQHAKRFMKALADNVRKFEQAHGEIQDQETPSMPIQFGGPTTKA